MDELIRLLTHYRPSERAKRIVQETDLVLLVGISGAGKDTVKKRLLSQDEYVDFVSHTTRKPRINNGIQEQEGIDYHFIDIPEAIRMIKAGEFIEVKEYSNNIYGTSTAGLMHAHETKKIAVNDIEVQGVNEYVHLSDTVKPIFLLPPSFEVWQQRMTNRYKGMDADPNDLNLRYETAIKEIKHAIDAGYYYFVINDDLDQTLAIVDAIVRGNVDKMTLQDGIRVAESIAKEIGTHLE